MELLTDVLPLKPVINEAKAREGVFELQGIVQRAGKKNQNGRIYERAILEREVGRYMDEFVRTGIAYGELDHPESAVVSLKNASHIIRDLEWKGDDLFGKIEVLDTPAGNIVKAIVGKGHTIGISSRGSGTVKQTTEGTLMVQDDFELLCWDIVSNPSTHGAYMKPVSMNESRIMLKVNKYDKINKLIRDIICETTCECSL